MQRDLRRLADTHFDLLIIGAGFYGALAAWDATLRGLSVALIDQGDFGGATSFNNLKTLHGGLRSLTSLNLSQMRLFVRERRALARVAPHLVQPMPFVVPTYRRVDRSATILRIALTLNDALSYDRHEGLNDPSLQLPQGRVLSRDECLRLNPVIDPAGVTGGALWHDYQMHNTDRMTLSFVLSAAHRGAATVNYVKASGWLRDGHRITGVHAEDVLSDERFDVRARTTLNAAGPWAGTLLRSLDHPALPAPPPLSRAMNLVIGRSLSSTGCGGLVRGRFLFLVPWRGRSLVGTSHDAHAGGPDRLQVTREDVASFLADARAAFPLARLTEDDIRLVHRGLLPMIAADEDQVKLLRESAVVAHHRNGIAGLVSIFGVRYTTARATAARAVDEVFHERHRTSPSCQTAVSPVVGGDMADKEQFVSGVLAEHQTIASGPVLRRLALTYGTAYVNVIDLMHRDRELASSLDDQSGVTGAEILHATRSESAVKLSDALIRRTEAGSAGHPGRQTVERAAAIMARELGWSETRTREEIADTERFYRLPFEGA
jgi:glycerol-3-phosphate dehydrogenase